MNKARLLIVAVVATMALTACNKYDNPVPEPEPQPTVDVDNPNESETDQPAYAPGL